MAHFRIHRMQGLHYVNVHLANESVRAESGALNYLTGDVTITSPLLPSLGGLVKALLAGEAIYRPIYTGTGVVTLESSLGGYHILDLQGATWILERGTYWASEGSVDLSYHREPLLTSLWAGEGLIYLQTRVSGHGKVALTTRGPVKEMTLEAGQSILTDHRSVIARTAEVPFRIQRPTRNWLGYFTAGEHWLRAYRGPGKILLNPGPYWRYWMMVQRHGEQDLPSRASY